MKYPFTIHLTLLLITTALFSRVVAQDAPYGPSVKITKADFENVYSAADSAAGAVVLSDVGSTDFVGNDKGNFSLIFQRYSRAVILDKRGYDIATIEIPIYIDEDAKEKVKDISAVTYNMENGSIQITKLDVKKNVYTENQDKHHKLVKFTLPAVKAGSIIEISYKLHSDFIFNLQPWTFQGIYPCRWSEYNVMMPSFYGYMSLTTGLQKYHLQTHRNAVKNFEVSLSLDLSLLGDKTQRYNISANVTYYRWVMKDVPAMRQEPFTSTLKNYCSRISFQLSEIKEPFKPEKILTTWPQAAKSLLGKEDFGADLQKENLWLDEVTKGIVDFNESQRYRISKIYEYVRDKFKCTDQSALLVSRPMEAVFKSKSGNVAELNLLLTAMLRLAGLTADPVILSLRGNGYPHALYPLMEQYNYVVCRCMDGNNPVLLDAASPDMNIGRLPQDCYNGPARVINENADALQLSPDSLMEKSNTNVLGTAEANDMFGFTVTLQPGYYESREWIKHRNTGGKEAVTAELKKMFEPALSVYSVNDDSLHKNAIQPVLKAELKMKVPVEGILYFDPSFGQGKDGNPFKDDNRMLPVEMPYLSDKVFQLNMQVPQGFVIEELPKPVIIRMNESNDASFEYRISASGGFISLQTQLQIRKTFFTSAEYQQLRDFYSQIIKKQAEPIVFKKKP